MALIRQFAFAVGHAGLRMRSDPAAALLVGAGIAAAAFLVSGVLGGSRVAESAAITRALEGVPSGQRAVTAVYADSGVSRRGVTLADIDPLANATVTRVSGEQPGRVLQFKLLTLEGAPVNLAAADDVGRWVRLVSGRMPETCTPSRCEVVLLGGGGEVPSQQDLRLDVVGEARLSSPALFAQLAGSEAARIGESFGLEREPPFVLAEGFEAVARLPALESLYRTYAWVSPLAPNRVQPWDIDRFTGAVTSGRSALKAKALNADLVAPVEELAAARDDGTRASRRILVIGGQAGALLLAFVILAAAAMRTEALADWQRLTWRGARRWQLGVVSGTQAATSAVAGGLAGWLAGSLLTAGVAERAGFPAAGALEHSTLAGEGIVALLILIAVASTLFVLALRTPIVRLRGRSISPLDAAAAGALLALILSVATGPPEGAALLLVPGLVAFVAAVVLVRVSAPLFRLLGRLGGTGHAALRLAALTLARRSSYGAIAVAFLAVSLGLAVLALVYRSSLAQGITDQAAYSHPLEASLREDLSPGGLVAPLEAAPFERYAALGRAVPVIRQRGSVTAAGGPRQVTVLALPAEALPGLGGWRDDFSPHSRTELAALLNPAATHARFVRLPDDAAELSVPASARGGDADVEAAIRTPRGDFAFVDLGSTRGAQTRTLRGSIPPEARGGELVALSIRRAATVEGHGSLVRVDGTITLGHLQADGTSIVSDYEQWVGTENVDAVATGRGATVRFLVGSSNFAGLFRPKQPTDGRFVPVLATPAVAAAAAADGTLPIRLPDAPLRARVVGVVERFPTTYGDAVIADATLSATALNADSPGAAFTNEIWIDGDADTLTRRLNGPPFDVLSLTTRADVERELETNPLTRGALWALVGAGGAGAFLALAGLALLLAADRRDDRGELADLEAQGFTPAQLRGHVRARAFLVTKVGFVGGIAIAAVLAALVVDMVKVTASRAAPDPPLLLSLDWVLIALSAFVYVLCAAALILLTTRRVPR
jgi:FtsX-like permease family